MSTATAPFRWRGVVVSAMLPTFLFSVGEGAILPVIPVIAHDLGASIAVAGLVAGMILVGTLLGDIPSGAVIARVGERTAMLGAAVVAILGSAVAVLARDPLTLGAGVLLIGVATAVFALARHALLTTAVPLSHRARALSTLGGVFRGGYLLGPFLGAAVLQLTGSTESVFGVLVVFCALAVVVLLVVRDPEAVLTARAGIREKIAGGARPPGLFATVRSSAGVLSTLGLGAMTVSALRATRQVVLPVWAVSIGLDETTTSLVIGIAAAVDFSLFFAGGWLMDRFGRLWTAVPATVGLGLGHLALALTAALPGRFGWFIAVAVLLSLANGIGAGILMTLGADVADPRHPAPFLGAWRFTTDTGAMIGPLLVSALTAAVGLPFAVGALGVLGLGGAAVLRVYVPRHSPAPVRITAAPSGRPRSRRS